MRFYDLGGRGEEREASDRILTLPNLLSFARLSILPIIFFDLAVEPLAHTRALILAFVFGASDWFDGYLARRLDQVTRLGQLLDPISDRLMIATVGVGMVLGDALPLWVLLTILARDAVVAIGALVLVAQQRRPPAVTKIGKTATFDLMFAIGFFLLASVLGSPEAPDTVTRWLAWAFYGVGIVLYYVALGQYVVAIIRRGDTPERPPREDSLR